MVEEVGYYRFSHSCSTAPGSSGSPLLNVAGQVIGVHTHADQSTGQMKNLATSLNFLGNRKVSPVRRETLPDPNRLFRYQQFLEEEGLEVVITDEGFSFGYWDEYDDVWDEFSFVRYRDDNEVVAREKRNRPPTGKRLVAADYVRLFIERGDPPSLDTMRRRLAQVEDAEQKMAKQRYEREDDGMTALDEGYDPYERDDMRHAFVDDWDRRAETLTRPTVRRRKAPRSASATPQEKTPVAPPSSALSKQQTIDRVMRKWEARHAKRQVTRESTRAAPAQGPASPETAYERVKRRVAERHAKRVAERAKRQVARESMRRPRPPARTYEVLSSWRSDVVAESTTGLRESAPEAKTSPADCVPELVSDSDSSDAGTGSCENTPETKISPVAAEETGARRVLEVKTPRISPVPVGPPLRPPLVRQRVVAQPTEDSGDRKSDFRLSGVIRPSLKQSGLDSTPGTKPRPSRRRRRALNRLARQSADSQKRKADRPRN